MRIFKLFCILHVITIKRGVGNVNYGLEKQHIQLSSSPSLLCFYVALRRAADTDWGHVRFCSVLPFGSRLFDPGPEYCFQLLASHI